MCGKGLYRSGLLCVVKGCWTIVCGKGLLGLDYC